MPKFSPTLLKAANIFGMIIGGLLTASFFVALAAFIDLALIKPYLKPLFLEVQQTFTEEKAERSSVTKGPNAAPQDSPALAHPEPAQTIRTETDQAPTSLSNHSSLCPTPAALMDIFRHGPDAAMMCQCPDGSILDIGQRCGFNRRPIPRYSVPGLVCIKPVPLTIEQLEKRREAGILSEAAVQEYSDYLVRNYCGSTKEIMISAHWVEIGPDCRMFSGTRLGEVIYWADCQP